MELKAYKFRAECPDDVFAVLRQLKDTRRLVRMEMQGYVADVVVELLTTWSLKQLKAIMQDIPDAHVMLETIEPFDQYTGERKETNMRCGAETRD